MKLYIDGDAFPNLLKPIIFRAIERVALPTFVVSNKRINIGPSEHIEYIIVNSGADEADNRIVEMVEKGDLVITSDIPLADRVITKKAFAMDHRGKFFDEENIKQSLAIRDFMQEIRDSGEMTKGPSPINQKDAHAFASQLNSFFRRQNIN
ncbi:MAG: YaiI/YqxD family protein [Bacteroidetes bacterium]|nr:YaiI/YqxD family protein [Bacteroidota bacterium]